MPFYKLNPLRVYSPLLAAYTTRVVESFFGSLKKEKIRRHIFKTRETARAEILDYIEVFYYRARRHQHLGNIRQADYVQQMAVLG